MTAPVFPDPLARLLGRVRDHHGRDRPPFALPHTACQYLLLPPLRLVRRLRFEEPQALRAYLRTCGVPRPTLAADADVLAALLQGTWRTRDWTWRLRIPALDPATPAEADDRRLHALGRRDPLHDSLTDWLAQAAQLIADAVMTPRDVLPDKALRLQIETGQGPAAAPDADGFLTLRARLSCASRGPSGEAAVPSLGADPATTLGIIAHELIHAILPATAPSHGRAFRDAAAALELDGALRRPQDAGLATSPRYPDWAYQAARELGSLPPDDPGRDASLLEVRLPARRLRRLPTHRLRAA